jgi:cytidine deaminase
MEKTKLDKETRQKLIDAGVSARKRAYAPYSKYFVGAAVLAASGKIYEGGNIENASYGATVCAERVAIFNAVSAGERKFIAMSVVGDDGGAPCGICRQVLAEFGLDILLLEVNKDGQVVREVTVADILPDPFTPANLGIDTSKY